MVLTDYHGKSLRCDTIIAHEEEIVLTLLIDTVSGHSHFSYSPKLVTLISDLHPQIMREGVGNNYHPENVH